MQQGIGMVPCVKFIAVIVLAAAKQGLEVSAASKGSGEHGVVLVAALGDLMPPTALAGIFAAQVVDEPNYFKILKKCLLPALVLDVWGILVIIYSNNVAALIK